MNYNRLDAGLYRSVFTITLHPVDGATFTHSSCPKAQSSRKSRIKSPGGGARSYPAPIWVESNQFDIMFIESRLI